MFSLLCCLRARPAVATAITLAAGGRSEFTIVVPANADGIEIKAAAILDDYFFRVSGIKLRVSTETLYKGDHGIYIGKTKKAVTYHTGITGDGLLIRSSESDLFLLGGSGQGIIYASYTFIEKYLNCRKYDSGPAYCPQQAIIHLPVNLTDLENPAFIYRETYYPLSQDAEYLQWHKLQRFEDLWGLWGHSFFKILPPKTYFNKHPDYYSLVNGRRTARQLCLSNPDVLGVAIEYLQKEIRNHPDAVYWSIAQNDGDGYCTCEKCQKLDQKYGCHQGSILSFVNRIASSFPRQTFTTLAYGYSIRPPAGIVPRSNVIMILSSIEANRQDQLQNDLYAADFNQCLQVWAELTPSIFVWNYTAQFTNYLAPFPDQEHLIPDLRYLRRRQVSGIFSQGSGDSYSDLAELNSYLLAAGLWNTDVNTDRVAADFLAGYYGRAASYIAIYLKQLQSALKNSRGKLQIYGNTVDHEKDYLSAYQLKSYDNILRQAELSVKDNALLNARVKRVRLGATYALLQLARSKSKREMFGSYGGLSALTDPSTDMTGRDSGLLTRVIRFSQQCKAAGVTEMSEGGPGPEQYLTGWKKLLEKTDQPVGSGPDLALDAKTSFSLPVSEDYPANGTKTLTDGRTGTPDYSFNWFFVYGNDLQAVIDLGAARNIATVSLNFLDDQAHNIFLPSGIVIMVSTDGKIYSQFGESTVKLSQSATPSIYQPSFAGHAKIRFIKITARCLRAMPAWKAGSVKKPALCCDEVLVY